ncbi:uncharacterized protein HMPREF1541_00827 [Cyphellophora europaea CBS 101466]|uniref:Conserved oligomeric Golgi complex subunit 6 n=1 Tax=Cyphellophora europaea (strain CBS 101466) TaxID=1220924 RepID=W2SD39_CYPE1|nr:uncharacterized protein HMPREF1541_00827 [Cyphellophora europaea CBS 101466]ETN46641.1 hypothetical protein HMPREF1541_00827 [Cyphellophora europaea CBS 101466]
MDAYLSGIDGPDGDGLGSPLSPGEDGITSRSANALSTKLATVLSASYADSEIREALRLFDIRDVQSEYQKSQTLKSIAEKEIIDANARIVGDFGHVAEQLKRVGVLLARLNDTCDQMRGHILAAKQESAPVLEEASILLARKQEGEAKQQLLEVFCKHFTLSDADLKTLTSSAEPLDERFFVVLQRVQQIHKDCEILLGTETQRLGLELMEQTTRNLDAGFKKLYTWIQREFKGLDLEDPHISGSIRRALRVLSDRPTLFQNCLDFFAQARETTLSEAFQGALTGTGSGQAIEFSTHDPLRYVGDMLAWIHSAAVSEKEALEGLFISDANEISKGLAVGHTSEPWARVRRPGGVDERAEEDDTSEHVFDGQKALSDLVSRNMVGVCQTLHQRIEVAVKNSGDPVLMYKVFNLLTFYQEIFSKLIGSGTTIDNTLVQLETAVLGLFKDTMDEEVGAATADTTPSPDLSPPTFLHVALKQFTDIARSRGPQMTGSELERLFSAVLSGIVDACADGASQLLEVRESNIYKANYLTALQMSLRSILSQVPPISLPLDKVNSELQTIRDSLSESVTTSLLDASGIGALLQEADTRPDKEMRRKWFIENLTNAALVLDDFLASGLMDAQEGLSRMSDKSAAKDIIGEAVDRFCAEFDELEGMIHQADMEGPNGEVDAEGDEIRSLADLYPRTGAEVRALLS